MRWLFKDCVQFRQFSNFSYRRAAMDITFLGTSSAQHSRTRNQSSLILRSTGSCYMVDCGEATIKQIQGSTIRLGNIKKIFITHMHGDHTNGLGALLSTLLSNSPKDVPQEPLEVYGPRGLRLFIRMILQLTCAQLIRQYVVHELHTKHGKDKTFPEFIKPMDYELPGRNIEPDESDRFIGFSQDEMFKISAATIKHSVTCFGYIFREPDRVGSIDIDVMGPILQRNHKQLAQMGIKNPHTILREIKNGKTVKLPDGSILTPPSKVKGKKICILGDTYDPSNIIQLAMNSDVVVHEATNAYLRRIFDKSIVEFPCESSASLNISMDARKFSRHTLSNCRKTLEFEKTSSEMTEKKYEEESYVVKKKTISHGHSTPEMAGSFAHKVKAKMLLLNHFSSRYAGDDDTNVFSAQLMEAFRKLAETEFSGKVICSRDFINVKIS